MLTRDEFELADELGRVAPEDVEAVAAMAAAEAEVAEMVEGVLGARTEEAAMAAAGEVAVTLALAWLVRHDPEAVGAWLASASVVAGGMGRGGHGGTPAQTGHGGTPAQTAGASARAERSVCVAPEENDPALDAALGAWLDVWEVFETEDDRADVVWFLRKVLAGRYTTLLVIHEAGARRTQLDREVTALLDACGVDTEALGWHVVSGTIGAEWRMVMESQWGVKAGPVHNPEVCVRLAKGRLLPERDELARRAALREVVALVTDNE